MGVSHDPTAQLSGGTGGIAVTRHLMIAACVAAVILPGAADGRFSRNVFGDVSNGVVVVIASESPGVPNTQGSGIVVGRTEVVTNCHVVSGPVEVAVRRTAGGRGRESWQTAAKLIKRNEERDLCLLFVEGLSDWPAATPVSFGHTRDVSIGDEVYAIGAPHGLELSLSRGVISQLRGDHGHAPLIQTDAATSPGSSGGGLFNETGELIGRVKISN